MKSEPYNHYNSESFNTACQWSIGQNAQARFTRLWVQIWPIPIFSFPTSMSINRYIPDVNGVLAKQLQHKLVAILSVVNVYRQHPLVIPLFCSLFELTGFRFIDSVQQYLSALLRYACTGILGALSRFMSRCGHYLQWLFAPISKHLPLAACTKTPTWPNIVVLFSWSIFSHQIKQSSLTFAEFFGITIAHPTEILCEVIYLGHQRGPR